MSALIRPALVVTVVLPLAVLACFGLRFVCDPEDFRRLLQEVRRGEELQQALQTLLRREEAKEHIAQEVIAQRCSLREALARFQEADREYAENTTVPSNVHEREWCDPKKHYRYITRIIQRLLRDRPEEAAVLRRLEKDYQQLRAGRQMPSTISTERTERNR
jgi:hypothetical protein